jgi:ribosomal protein S18 acetylase RimI-like enzyme
MGFEFKKAILPRELPDVLAFDARVFTQTGDIWDRDDWVEHEVYWMLVNGVRVGCCALQGDVDYDGEPKTDSLLIASVGISPERRNEGLGTRFTAWQIEHARKRGYATIVATTRESNAAMIAVYEKLGFIVRCMTDYYEEPKERAVVFDRSL